MLETTPPANDPVESYLDDETPLAKEPVAIVAAEVLPVEVRAARDWTTDQITITNAAPKRIVGAHLARELGVLRMTGELYIAKTEQTCTPNTAFLTDYHEFSHRKEVWGLAPDATAVTVYVALENTDGG